MRKALLGVALALWLAPTGHAAAASGRTAILYATDWPGPTQIFAVDPARKQPIGQVTFRHLPSCVTGQYPIACGFLDPIPAPDGRHLLFRSTDLDHAALWVANADGRNPHMIVPRLQFAGPGAGQLLADWSADSRRIRYTDAEGIHVVRLDGSDGPCCVGRWKPVQREYRASGESIISPDGRWIASADSSTITLTNRRTSRTRVLVRDAGFNLYWAPDSKSLAYIVGSMSVFGLVAPGDLRVVTLAGKVRTVVSRRSRYGGQIVSLAWTPLPATIRYRRPAPVSGHYAGSLINRLAGDGARVAYATCAHVSVWTPAANAVVDGASATCATASLPGRIYDLAVAGSRVAYTTLAGGNTTIWSLNGFSFQPGLQPFALASGTNTCCLPVPQVAGAGDLLVFATRHVEYLPNPTAVWELRRAGPTGCDCPLLQTYVQPIPEPFTLDVDRDRIAIARTDSVEVFDADLSRRTVISGIPVERRDFAPAVEARLSGQDLFVRVGRNLVDYDLDTATRRRTWPLVGVSAVKTSEVLQDVANGLAAYVGGGEIHVLRLAEGSDKTIGYGSLAQFIDSGLVYADGSRLHHVSYSQLALRAF